MTESARCTLTSFLEAPSTTPPRDWAVAASHSNSAATLDSTDLVERADAARARAELLEQSIAQLERARTPQPTLDRATAVLAAAFNVSSGRAFECLLWVAEQADISRTEAADRFMARVDALGAEGRDRHELLGILAALVGQDDARAS